MNPSKPWSADRGGRRAITLLCVLLVFGAETVFAAVLPLYGAGIEYADSALIGLALSLSSGAGFLLLPFFVRSIDGGRLRFLMLVSGIVMVLSCLLVKESSGLGPAALLFGSLGFGVARIIGVVGLLTMVARLPGSRTVNQGWNGGLQRLGSLMALLISGVLFASGNWNGVFVMLSVMIVIWWVLADRSATFADPVRERRRGTCPRRTPRQRLAIATECLAALRNSRVLAAAGLNILNLLALMHANSFFAMAFAPEHGAVALTSLVVTTVVLRDGVAVLSGLLFPAVLHGIGSRRMMWCLALLAVLPFPLIICFPAAAVPGAYLAAIAHGVMAGWGSATANLLATGADQAGAGLRIASSQLPAGVVMLVAPFAFGAAVVGLGVQSAYGLLFLVLATSAWVMVRASRGADLAG